MDIAMNEYLKYVTECLSYISWELSAAKIAMQALYFEPHEKFWQMMVEGWIESSSACSPDQKRQE